MLRCHARSLHRRAQVAATRWPAAFRSVVSRGCGWSRRAAAGGFDLRTMHPWRGGGLAPSRPFLTSCLYKTRSLGYLAEPLDISAEQGYLNPRVGYLDR